MNSFYFIVGSIIFILLFYFFYKRNNKPKKVIPPNLKTKNKWLYPTDNFGKLERGVVRDESTSKKGENNSNQDIIKLIAEENIITNSRVGVSGQEPEQWRRFLKLQKSTDEELIVFTNHPNPVVRCYTFHALAIRNHSLCSEIFKIGITDLTEVNTQFGCLISKTRVCDYYINCVLNPENTDSFYLTVKQVSEIRKRQDMY